jgi:MFS family permease
MILRPKFEIALLATAVAVTRFVFRSHYLYDLDSVNFGLAIRRFDPRVHQPHPPGYFLYICLGRVFNFLLHDANLALIVMSILASCGVVILIYKMALDWFGQSAARFAGAIFLFSPLAWFHGTVALTYSVEAFFSALLGYLCWRISSGSKQLILLAAVILGISAGVRPSSLLFLGPLFLFALWKGRHKPKSVVAGVAALALTLACWTIPMLWASGGIKAYFDALISLWQLVPSKGTVFNSSPATSIARACTIVFILFLIFGAASLAPLAIMRRTKPADRGRLMFVTAWTAPALCFFTFVFLKFVNSGYLLLLSAPGCICLGYCLAAWWAKSKWPEAAKLGLLVVGATVNVLIFLVSPLYCSYRSVRHFETQLAAICQALPEVASASDTLILSFDSHYLGYRHAGYYLPGYLTLQYPEVKLREGTRIFAMQGDDTRLLAGLPTAGYSKFVIFPLAENAEDKQYLEKVMSKLPSHGLTVVHRDGKGFLIGPVSELPLLFPPTPAPAR